MHIHMQGSLIIHDKASSHMDLMETGRHFIILSTILCLLQTSLIQFLKKKLVMYVVMTSCVCLTLQQLGMLILEAVLWTVYSSRKCSKHSLFRVSKITVCSIMIMSIAIERSEVMMLFCKPIQGYATLHALMVLA